MQNLMASTGLTIHTMHEVYMHALQQAQKVVIHPDGRSAAGVLLGPTSDAKAVLRISALSSGPVVPENATVIAVAAASGASSSCMSGKRAALFNRSLATDMMLMNHMCGH